MPGVVSPIFVGRRAELAVLGAGLARALDGSQATVLVEGEAGVGKTRLVGEFGAHLAGRARLLTGACVDAGASTLPFAPFTATLRGLVGELGRERLFGLLPHGSPGELARLLPALGGLDPAADLDLARTRLFEDVLALFAGLARSQPVVLVLEDLHWADRSSRDLLHFLVRNQQAMPGTVILVTYRSDELSRGHPLRTLAAELDRVAWVVRLALPRLSRQDVTDQIRALLDREPRASLVALVYGRSEGNPLFVEALVDQAGRQGAALPDTLLDLVLRRIEGLPDATRQAVRVAAVGGGSVDHRGLAAVCGIGDARLVDVLRPAVDAGVLLVDGDGLAFRHALIREAIVGDLLPGERVSLHTRYAQVLEEREQPSARVGYLAEVADHWYAAGATARAFDAAWRAARSALSSLAYAEELAMLGRVLELWDGVPDAADRLGMDHLAVLEQAVEAARLAGEHERGEALATMALEEIDRDRHRVRAGLLLVQRGTLRWSLGHDGYLQDHRDAVAIVPDGHPARAHVLTALASQLVNVPLPDEACSTAEEALASARAAGDDLSEASSLITLATVAGRRGDLPAQLPRLAEAAAIAERIGTHDVLMRAVLAEATLLEAYGQGDRAEWAARRGIAAAIEAGLGRTSAPPHLVNLASTLIAHGRWDEALDEIDGGMQLVPPPALHAHLMCLRAVVDLARGELYSAERAIAFAREVFSGPVRFAQDPMLVARLEPELRLVQRRLAEAVALTRQALDSFDLPNLSRFAWPLLCTGARIAAAAADGAEGGGLAGDGARLLGELYGHAAGLPAFTPVQRAHAQTFAAEAARADRVSDAGSWQAVVAAWDDLDDSYRAAWARVRGAEATVAGTGDRTVVAGTLRRARAAAIRLGARPLREEIDLLARLARIDLDLATDHVPASVDPLERARRQLGLTARELDVLRLVAVGRTNREIADTLYISPKTASVHVSHILTKLGATNRVEAAAAAHRHGIAAEPAS